MNASFIRRVLVLLPLLLLPTLVQAQEDTDAVQRRNNCRLAAQVIETGHPAPHAVWAWQYIGFCEPTERVRVFLSAVRRVRTSTDVAIIERALLPAAAFRDATLFHEVLDVAGDPKASVPARVVAFMALAVIRNPEASPHYERFSGGLDEHGVPRGGCSARRSHPAGYTDGPSPLPGDYLQRIRDLANRVRLNTAEPADVRSAAACT